MKVAPVNADQDENFLLYAKLLTIIFGVIIMISFVEKSSFLDVKSNKMNNLINYLLF